MDILFIRHLPLFALRIKERELLRSIWYWSVINHIIIFILFKDSFKDAQSKLSEVFVLIFICEKTYLVHWSHGDFTVEGWLQKLGHPITHTDIRLHKSMVFIVLLQYEVNEDISRLSVFQLFKILPIFPFHYLKLF
jgi:hypothetical protein